DSTGVPSADPPRLMEAQQQAAWNATQQDYPRDVLVPQLVAAQAAATPEAVALVAQSRGARSVLTYRELDSRANRVAHHLRALGGRRTADSGRGCGSASIFRLPTPDSRLDAGTSGLRDLHLGLNRPAQGRADHPR